MSLGRTDIHTLDLLVGAFLAVAGIDKVAQGVTHVEATDEVMEDVGVHDDSAFGIGDDQAPDVGIYADDHLQVVGRVRDG